MGDPEWFDNRTRYFQDPAYYQYTITHIILQGQLTTNPGDQTRMSVATRLGECDVYSKSSY